MKGIFYTIGVVLLIATSTLSIPVSENEEQSKSQSTPPKKDDSPPSPKPPQQPQVSQHQYSGNAAPTQGQHVYDPNLYPALVPGNIPSYPDPFPGAYAPSYATHVGYAPAPTYPTSYVVQTGYEGYLVPSNPVREVAEAEPFTYLRGLIPNAMITWIVRSLAVIMGTITIVFMGGALTTAVCSLTPFCTVSFRSLSFFNWNETARDVGKMLGKEITPERVRRAANFVRTAIKKYSELQSALSGDEQEVN